MRRKGKNGHGYSLRMAQPRTLSGAVEPDAIGTPASRNIVIKKEALSSSATQAESAPLDRENLKHINHFVRGHTFIQMSLSGHTSSQRRVFERDVYDYARGLGLQRPEAKREVLKARGFCGEFDYDSDVSLLGDEVDDSAQFFVNLSSKLNASQSTPHIVSGDQPASGPTPKHPKLSYPKISRISNPHPGTSSGSLDTTAVAAISEALSSKAAKKSRKRKNAEQDEEPSTVEFVTRPENSSRGKSKKPKDNPGVLQDVSQPDDSKEISSKHRAKRQKLEVPPDRLDTPKHSMHGDSKQQPSAETSAMGKKQKKGRRKKKNKECDEATKGKKGKKAADIEGATGEVPASYENEPELSKKKRKAARLENQRREKAAKEDKRLAKAERNRRKREVLLNQIEERRQDTEAMEVDSVKDQEMLSKPTEAAPALLLNNTTVSTQGATNREPDSFAQAMTHSRTSEADAVRATSPELDSVDQPGRGPEVKSVYFTPDAPEKQKRKGARLSPSVKIELLEAEIRTVKTDLEMRKEVREKQARFRAELAEKCRISNAQAATVPLIAKVDTSSSLRQPTSQIAEIVEAVPRDEVRTTPLSHPMYKSYLQSEDLVEAENDKARDVEKALTSLERALDNTGLAEASKTRGSQPANRTLTNGITIDESAGRSKPLRSEKLPQEVAKATIQPVMPESRIEYNGWIPINHTARAAKDQPGLKESCAVSGTIKRPDSNNPAIELDLAHRGKGEKPTLGTDMPVSSQEKRLLRKRESRPDAEGAEELSVRRSTRRLRNVNQESLDFQSPMIQTAKTNAMDTPASGYTEEGVSSKLEDALTKMDPAFMMLGGMEHKSEGQSATIENHQSNLPSGPGSERTPLAWSVPGEHPAQVHEERQGDEVSALLTHPSERGECNLPSISTSFVPPAITELREFGQEPPKSFFGVLVPPTLPRPPRIRRKNSTKASRFFPRPLVEKTSCIPFPPLEADSFGLVQERLCHEPFRLLIAVTFLNKTRGKVALPVCYDLFERYPTPKDLANADPGELGFLIRGLGLQNTRGARMIKLAQMWVENPPQKGQRYRKFHYPRKNDGRNVKRDEAVSDDDPRVAWEIAHLPGAGAYALDSWRIFCRDELRGLPIGLPRNLCPELVEEELQKERTRVLPQDKELRAYLRWRWLRLGWIWNPVTGERQQAEPAFLDKLRGGGVSFEGDEHSTVEGVEIVMETLRTGVRQDEQCEGSLVEAERKDIVAVPMANGNVEGPQAGLATNERVVLEPTQGERGKTDTFGVMSQSSVADSQSGGHREAVPNLAVNLALNLTSGDQRQTRARAGSETSPAMKAALSWLHCEDIEDASRTAQGTFATEPAITNEEVAVERNPCGADCSALPTRSR